MAAAAPELSAVWAEASALLGALGSAVAGGEQTEATNHNKGQLDASVAMVFAAGLFVFNWGSRKGLLAPVARGLLLPPGATQAQVDKFGQSASEALCYGLSFVLGMFVVPRQPWIWIYLKRAQARLGAPGRALARLGAPGRARRAWRALA